MSELAGQIADNVARVRERIAAAAERSGRSETAVRLVAVTKYVSSEVAAALADCGCRELGESRPQELWSKAGQLQQANLAWHLIGHLQRNKLRRTLPLVTLIHSVDSRRLLSALEAEAAEAGNTVNVLLETNISLDAAKTGLPPHELEPILAHAAQFPHVAIRGLMGMASLSGGEQAAHRDFARLRALRDRLASTAGAGVALGELSMGMSGDFEAAIEEGATIVRVGSALFEGIDV